MKLITKVKPCSSLHDFTIKYKRMDHHPQSVDIETFQNKALTSNCPVFFWMLWTRLKTAFSCPPTSPQAKLQTHTHTHGLMHIAHQHNTNNNTRNPVPEHSRVGTSTAPVEVPLDASHSHSGRFLLHVPEQLHTNGTDVWVWAASMFRTALKRLRWKNRGNRCCLKTNQALLS